MTTTHLRQAPAVSVRPDRDRPPVDVTKPARLPAPLDRRRLRAVREQLREAAPIVARSETERLSARLAAVARGQALLLQGGDSADLSAGDLEAHLNAQLRAVFQMAVVLAYGSGLPVVKMAETSRPYAQPNPGADGPADRMLLEYGRSSLGMNLVRGLCDSGVADLNRIHEWNLDMIRTGSDGARFRPFADEIGRGLRFMAASGFTGSTVRGAELFTGRQALALDYERAMLGPDVDVTRPELGSFSGSAHFLWIDARRMRRPGAAYADFLGRLANPIGLRIAPDTTPAHAAELVRRLDPQRTPGRLTLISAMGDRLVRTVLPPIVEEVTATGRKVIWQCDPLYRNTPETARGCRIPDFGRVCDEVTGFFEAHRRLGTHPGGIRVGTAATETVSGPCLTAPQSVELAFMTAELLRG